MDMRVRAEEVLRATHTGYLKYPGPTYTNYSHPLIYRKQTQDTCTNYWSARRGLEKLLRESPSNRSFEVALNLVKSYDQGGPFLSQSIDFASRPAAFASESLYYGLVGDVVPHGDCYGSTDFKSAVPMSTLFLQGGQAIHACRPLRPKSGLSVAIGELLHDGPPKIPGRFFVNPGATSASNDFLNWEFGIRPTVSEINDSVRAFRQADATWRQIARDNGRDIRRRFYFPEVQSYQRTTYAPSYGSPVGAGVLYASAGTCYKYVQLTSRVWFAGAFRYSMPGGSDRWSKFRREAMKWEQAYGLGVTPETLYQLAPWSWLIEWFADFSSAISWLSSAAVDGLAMRYGYIMAHQLEDTTWSLVGLKPAGAGKSVLSASFSRIRETKQRERAYPWGFGVEEESLTPRQYAILAALGFTKGNHNRSPY